MEQLTQRFENVTSAQFHQLAAKVKDLTGVAISGPSGTASAKDYQVTWDFNAGTGQLEITCNEAPWPESLFPQKIAQKISALVTGVLDAPTSS